MAAFSFAVVVVTISTWSPRLAWRFSMVSTCEGSSIATTRTSSTRNNGMTRCRVANRSEIKRASS